MASGSRLPRPSLAKATSQESVASSVASSSTGVGGGWKVGEVCWANGTKKGKVAFVGRTKFAPGEWIGVILETEEGKNDGSVDGQRYFRAPANHGLFVKSGKLSREGMAKEEDEVTFKVPSVPETPALTPLTPLTPKRLSSSEDRDPLLTSTPTEASVESGLEAEIGERVVVSGTKLGILRFLGPTDFASGLWAGVELEQPIGKNDGTVQGKRYFVCKPQYGIFVAASKIQRATNQGGAKFVIKHTNTSRMRDQRGRLHRSGSQESLSSISSFCSSTATGLARERARTGAASPSSNYSFFSRQASFNRSKRLASPRVGGGGSGGGGSEVEGLVREKERHIEALLRERELERTETLRLGEECETLRKKLEATEKELEEERGRREDASFRLEETEILRQEAQSHINALKERLGEEEASKVETPRVALLGSEDDPEVKIRKLKEQVTSLETERSQLDVRIAELEAKLAAALERAVAAEASSTHARNELHGIRQAVEEEKSLASQEFESSFDRLCSCFRRLSVSRTKSEEEAGASSKD